MKILVANLGSTSFKYRLFDMTDERVLARGGVERIGAEQSRAFVEANGQKEETTLSVKDHAAAVRLCLEQLSDPKRRALKGPSELAAIGFKAVHAKGISGVQRVDERVLAAMDAYADVAPAHNPPYTKAMRLLARELPHIPLVAAFETGFHETISPAERLYAVPLEWAEKHGVQRWGFHGASHRYIAGRAAQLLGKPGAKIISCHLGGSSSICAIKGGESRASSLGMSPQSGLPHNNRVGDFDVFALPPLMRETGKSLEQLLDDLANRSGLLGISGHNDLRDIEAGAVAGDRNSKLALDVFVAAVRHYLGAYLLLLNGADAIVFTGGIGENSSAMRAAVCANLDWFGIGLDPVRNAEAKSEVALHTVNSRVQLWIMPTNEELVVARQAKALLEAPVIGTAMEKDLDILFRLLDPELVRGGFRRLVPTPTAPEIEIAAVWKQQTGMRVTAVAAVALGRFTNHPGDFAHCVKRRVARAIGYFPFFGRLSLHTVIFGGGILTRSDELQGFMEGGFGRVRLPSIHVVDLDASSALASYQDDDGVHTEIIEPPESSVPIMPGLLFRTYRLAANALRSSAVCVRLAYSHRTSRAMRSVCFQGGSEGECSHLLDRGIEAFVQGYEEK